VQNPPGAAGTGLKEHRAGAVPEKGVRREILAVENLGVHLGSDEQDGLNFPDWIRESTTVMPKELPEQTELMSKAKAFLAPSSC